MLLDPIASPYLVPFDGTFRADRSPTEPPRDADGNKKLEKLLEEDVDTMARLQRKLYADNRYAVLLIFQAMDAAGKDGTIRAVLSGIDPAGCQVQSFKKPSSTELDHDWLWRTSCALPEKGRIGVFNRSYYEEVLVVRVEPDLLQYQQLPNPSPLSELWAERYASIRDHELHLSRNGVVILKFWLNVSKDEQARRLLSRIEDPEKNWKFEAGDVRNRRHWDEYMEAYEALVNATSKPWAPWYAVPADDKTFMRSTIADIVRARLASLDLRWPEIDAADAAVLDEMAALLRESLE